MRWHWSVWLKGLLAAVISGAATGVGTLLVAPEVAVASVAKVAGVGALIGAAGYLKQSPLPPEE